MRAIYAAHMNNHHEALHRTTVTACRAGLDAGRMGAFGADPVLTGKWLEREINE
jgi:hypothetical protein